MKNFLKNITVPENIIDGCGVQFSVVGHSLNLSYGEKCKLGKADGVVTDVMRIIFPDKIVTKNGTIISGSDLLMATTKSRWLNCRMTSKCCGMAEKLEKEAFVCETCFSLEYGKVNNRDIENLAILLESLLRGHASEKLKAVYFKISNNEISLLPEQSMKCLRNGNRVVARDYLQLASGHFSFHHESGLIFCRAQRNALMCDGRVSLFLIEGGQLIPVSYQDGTIGKSNHDQELADACQNSFPPNKGNIFCQGISIGGQLVATPLTSSRYQKMVEFFANSLGNLEILAKEADDPASEANCVVAKLADDTVKVKINNQDVQNGGEMEADTGRDRSETLLLAPPTSKQVEMQASKLSEKDQVAGPALNGKKIKCTIMLVGSDLISQLNDILYNEILPFAEIVESEIPMILGKDTKRKAGTFIIRAEKEKWLAIADVYEETAQYIMDRLSLSFKFLVFSMIHLYPNGTIVRIEYEREKRKWSLCDISCIVDSIKEEKTILSEDQLKGSGFTENLETPETQITVNIETADEKQKVVDPEMTEKPSAEIFAKSEVGREESMIYDQNSTFEVDISGGGTIFLSVPDLCAAINLWLAKNDKKGKAVGLSLKQFLMVKHRK